MAQLMIHPADTRSQTRNMPRRQFTGGDSLASVLNGRRGIHSTLRMLLSVTQGPVNTFLPSGADAGKGPRPDAHTRRESLRLQGDGVRQVGSGIDRHCSIWGKFTL